MSRRALARRFAGRALAPRGGAYWFSGRFPSVAGARARTHVGDADTQAIKDQEAKTNAAEAKLASGAKLEPEDEMNLAVGAMSIVAFAIGGPPAAALVGASWALVWGAMAGLARLIGRAGAGPGTCVTDPPTGGPNDPRWKHWDNPHVGPPSSPPTNAWEAFAQPALGRAWELQANCGPTLHADAFAAELAATWNRTHKGPAHVYMPFTPSYWGEGDVLLGLLTRPLSVNMGDPVAAGGAGPRYTGGLHAALQGLSSGMAHDLAVQNLFGASFTVDDPHLADGVVRAKAALVAVAKWLTYYGVR